MGVLTVMKLGFIAASVVCFLFITTWVLMYCPQPYYLIKYYREPASPETPAFQSASLEELDINEAQRERTEFKNLDDYFDYEEKKMVEEWKEHKEKKKSAEKEEKQREKLKEKENQSKNIALPLHLYTDDMFESMMSQTNHKEVSDYEKFAETPRIQIYRKPKEGGLYEYKMYAFLENYGPEQIATSFLDNDYRLYWDKYITEIIDVESHDIGPDVVYMNVDFPWPLGDRDYVYTREKRKLTDESGAEYVVIIMHSVKQNKIPEKNGRIRIYDYHQKMSLTNYKDHGTKVFIHYSDNPRGSIPKFLVNWAAKTGVPEFLDSLEEACRKYPAYQQEMNNKRTVKTN